MAEKPPNQRAQERAAGRSAARLLQSNLRSLLGARTTKDTGDLLKTNAGGVMQGDELQRIRIRSPRYGFMLNFGFEGVKSNGVRMKLQAINHLPDAIDKSGVLETLSDDISDIRADLVVASINFGNGK